ncbi:MAG: RecQ family ATP-dependent DNA helicase [Chloroflexota bacterium]
MTSARRRTARGSATTLDRSTIHRHAREALGHERLLPGQAEAVQAVLAGMDTVALLPTGGGKSAIYQLAGIERPGPTVVVSPLLALQQDQLDGLEELGLSGGAVNSSMSATARDAVLRGVEREEIEFVLLAPEQLARSDVLDRLRRAHASLFVVDEAHCVSEWGPDFRPEYRRLGTVRDALGGAPILALTATASPPVRDDIVRWLKLHEPRIVARGFDRPEIFLGVTRQPDAARKRAAVIDWVTGAERPGIVYVATRRASTEIADTLRERGVRADPYHAGLGGRRRETILDAFMADELEVVVATVAFGMGVDKSDVRFVAHADPSDSLDAYHQEIGRAGRDGERAEAQLFFDPADLGLRRFQTIPPPVAEPDVRVVIKALAPGRRTAADIAQASKLSVRRAEQITGRLEELELVTTDPDGTLSVADGLDADGLPAEVVGEQERRRQHARSRVELLRGYADTNGCRRRFLLNALGEEYEPPCGNCDNCVSGRTAASDVDASPSTFAINDRVNHATFGPGEVTRVEGDRMVVRFESVGYRTLSLPEVEASDLVRRA